MTSEWPGVRQLALCCAVFAHIVAAADNPLAITNVTVIDVAGKLVQREMTVVITGERITSVMAARRAQFPQSTRTLDGTGKFLIPGLWDMHTHSWRSSDWVFPLEVANGVVGIRDMNGPPDANAWRAQQLSADVPPTVFLGSPILDGPKPAFPNSIAIAGAEQARRIVREQKAHGAAFIKVLESVPRDTYLAILEEASKLDISVAGHVPVSVRASDASDAGIKCIEHLAGVSLECSSREQELRQASENGARIYALSYETFDDAKAKALFARFLHNGTWQCPTLVVSRSVSLLNRPSELQKDERLKYVPKAMRQRWDPQSDSRFKDADENVYEGLKRTLEGKMELVGRMHRAGIPILAGTDILNPYTFPGFSLHDELELLVQAGLSPREALAAATVKPAQFMGQSDIRGTIEVGKIADLVLLDRDPLADIRNTRSIRAVVHNGKLLTRDVLDRMLANVESAASK